MTTEPWRGVWVTIERPWDLAIGGAPAKSDPALLVIEIPLELFTEYEWVQDEIGYREALIPAAELNRHPVWRAWECAECFAVEREHAPGWTSELIWDGHERISVCPRCQSDAAVTQEALDRP